MDKTPEGLGEDGVAFWARATAEREFCDIHDLERLRIGAKLLDEIRRDEELIKHDGRFIRARLGRQIPHPAVKVVAENRQIFLRIIRDLGLDQVTLPDEPRTLF